MIESKYYKVWVEVEEIIKRGRRTPEEYRNVDLEFGCAMTFTKEDEAVEFARVLTEHCMAPKVVGIFRAALEDIDRMANNKELTPSKRLEGISAIARGNLH